ncbi:hypothetical protein BDV11DRAFT_183432 [Aspergillus similis]
MRKEGVSIILAEISGEDSAIKYPDEYTIDGKVDSMHPNDRGTRSSAHMVRGYCRSAEQTSFPNRLP